MKDTVRRLLFVHFAVLAVAVLGSSLVWGLALSLSSLVGVLCFSLPVIAFSALVLQASQGPQERFWGRFMAAEVLKWVSSGVLLGLAFWSGLLVAQPLLAGFFLSVLVQVFFPIFVPRESSHE